MRVTRDVVCLGPHRLAPGLVRHRAQLVDQERLPALADPLLAKEHRSAIPLHEQRPITPTIGRQDDRRRHGDHEGRGRA